MAWVLYSKQRRVLDWLSQYVQKSGHAPTLREIKDGLKLRSISTVHEHLCNLRDRGIIVWDKTNKNRGIRIVGHKKVPDSISIPVVGFLSSNSSIEIIKDTNSVISVPKDMVSTSHYVYAILAKCNLIDEGVLDKDYLVIEETEEVANGATALVLLDNEVATLKKVYQETTRVRLESANPLVQPTSVPKIKIKGKLMGLLRLFGV